MKLLEKGAGWSIKATCTGNGNGGGGCGAKLEVEEADIYLTHRFPYDGSHDIFYTFKCCECKAQTDLPESKVPGRISSRLIEEWRNRNRSMDA